MRKNFFQRMKMPLTELEAYYRAERAEKNLSQESVRGIGCRKATHFLIILLLKIKRILSRQKLTVVGNRQNETDKTFIYACTHIGRYDVEMALESIHKQCHIFVGDPHEFYRSIEGIILFFNGVIFADTDYREDCHNAKELCVRLLTQGGSLMIFPEGAWNITENQVVMPLYDGTAEMAIRTGAEIIPVAIEQYDKQYYVNIGENISPIGFDISHKHELTNLLRDSLCSLKWDIWERLGIFRRCELGENYSVLYLENIMKETENGYTIEEIIRTRYHTRAVSREEAFSFMEKLIPRRENAWLFDKRNFGGLI